MQHKLEILFRKAVARANLTKKENSKLNSTPSGEYSSRGREFEHHVGKSLSDNLPGTYYKAKSNPPVKSKYTSALQKLASPAARLLANAVRQRTKRTPGAVAHVDTKKHDLQVQSGNGSPIADIQVKLMKMRADGSLRAPTERSSTVKSFASDFSSGVSVDKSHLERAHETALAIHHKVRNIAKLAGVRLSDNTYSALKKSKFEVNRNLARAIKTKSRIERGKIVNSFKTHMSGMNSDQIANFMHKHLRGGKSTPIPSMRLLTATHPTKQDHILHMITHPDKALDTVLQHYKGTFRVSPAEAGKSSTRFHIYGTCPRTKKEHKVMSFNVVDGDRPHKSAINIATTTRIPQLAARATMIGHNSRNNYSE